MLTKHCLTKHKSLLMILEKHGSFLSAGYAECYILTSYTTLNVRNTKYILRRSWMAIFIIKQNLTTRMIA